MPNGSGRDEDNALAYGLAVALVVVAGLLIYLWVA